MENTDLRTEFSTETKTRFNVEWVAYNDYVEWLERKLVKLLTMPCLDHTFATRLKSFVSDIQTNCQMGFEEREYIERVANKLLEYQKQNAVEQWEKDYLERCHK